MALQTARNWCWKWLSLWILRAVPYQQVHGRDAGCSPCGKFSTGSGFFPYQQVHGDDAGRQMRRICRIWEGLKSRTVDRSNEIGKTEKRNAVRLDPHGATDQSPLTRKAIGCRAVYSV